MITERAAPPAEDTTVLLYAVGGDHPLAGPCRRLVEAVGEGRVTATTPAEAIQGFVHVRARRRTRRDAAELGRSYAELLSPLLAVSADALAHGLRLFERHQSLGAFDAILAATALGAGPRRWSPPTGRSARCGACRGSIPQAPASSHSWPARAERPRR